MKPIVSARNILIIKHGALGDFILALPAMAAIRARFPDAHIAIQTTLPLVPLCDACPYINEIDPYGRAKGMKAMLGLANRVRAEKYDIIYDLQNSERTAMLHFLLGPFRPNWNGIAGGATHRVRDKRRLQKHVIERMAEHIAHTGIPYESAVSLPDLSWAMFVTTGKYMDANEDKVRKIVRARVKAVDFIYANREETAKIYAKHWNLPEAEANAILPKFYEIKHWKRGAFNMKGFATMLEGMELVGELEKGFDIKKLLDDRFQSLMKEK